MLQDLGAPMVEVNDSVTGVITKSETILLVGGYMRCVHKIPILVVAHKWFGQRIITVVHRVFWTKEVRPFEWGPPPATYV